VSIEEELALDFEGALAGVDALEDRLTSAATAAQDALSAAMTAALDDVQALADLGGEALTEGLSSSMTAGAAEGVTAIQDGIDGIDGEVAVALDLDTAALDELQSDLDGASTEITVAVEDSALTEAVDHVDALSTAVDNASTQVVVEADTSGLDEATGQAQSLGESLGDTQQAATQAGGAVEGMGGQVDGAVGFVGGLHTRLATGLNPAMLAGGAAAVGLGVGFDALIKKAINADAASRRFNEVLGGQAENVDSLRDTIPGLSDDLGTLSIRTGSSASRMREAAASFTAGALTAGISAEATADYSKQLLVLANYIAVTNPKLGTADEIVTKLGGALGRGGRFAANFGLGFLSAGDIAERGGQLFNKAAGDLGYVEKQAAGLSLTFDKLGPTMAAAIDKGVDQPIVKMRSLEAELSKVLVAGTKPLIEPFVESLEAAAPIIESAAGLFTSLASGVFPVLAFEAQALGKALEFVANILDNKLVRALVAAGGGYVAATRSLSLLLGLAERLGPSFARLATAIGSGNLSERFRAMTTGIGAARAAQRQLEVTTDQLATSQAALTGAINQVAAANAEGAALQKAYNTQQALAATLAKNVAASKAAEAEVTAATLAVKNQEVGASERLTVALGQQALADSTLAATTAELGAATALTSEAMVAAAATEAGQAAALTTVAGAAEAATVAQTEAATSTALAGSASTGLAAALGPLGLVAGLAIGAMTLFGSSTSDAAKEVDDAISSLDEYRDSLGLTNRQLSNLGSADAAASFERTNTSIDDFIEAVREMGDDDSVDTFNERFGAMSADVTAAIDGNVEAQRRFRQALLDSGEVSISKVGGETKAQQKAIRDEYLRTGDVVKAQKFAFTEFGLSVSASTSVISEAFEEEAAASAKAREELLQRAKAEIAAGDATDVGAIATLAATGGLDELTAKQEGAARALLETQEATDAKAEADRNASVVSEQFGEAIAAQVDAVDRANAALARGAELDPGDFAAARALAASQAFDQLPEDVQSSVQALVDYSDEARTAAQENGDLTTSTGEVGSSFVSLNGLLDGAIEKWQSLSGAKGNTLQTERDLRGSFDDTVATLTETSGHLRDYNEKSREQRDIARGNADAVAGSLRGIREYGASLLQQGVATDDVKNRMKLLTASLVEQVTSVGANKEEVNELVAAEGLLPDQIDQNFKASGIDALTRQLQILNLTMLGIPPEKVIAITAIGDATKQAEAIEAAIAGLPPDKQVAVRTVLDAPSVAEAKAGVEEFENPVLAAIKAGVDPAAAFTAKAEIDALAAERGIIIEATAETVTAVADLDQAANPDGKDRQARLNADDQGTATREGRKLDNTARQRDAIILAQAQTTAAEIELNRIAALGTKVGQITANAAASFFTGGPERGGAFGPGAYVQAFESGGTSEVSEAVRRRLRQGGRSDSPGFYGPGAYAVAFAEDNTEGEYFVSRKRTERARNENVLNMAARDFGYDLVPQGAAQAPVVNVSIVGGGQSPEVVDGLGTIAGLLERNLRRPSIGQVVIEQGGMVPVAIDDDGTLDALDRIAQQIGG
jgi:hypothetical protein